MYNLFLCGCLFVELRHTTSQQHLLQSCFKCFALLATAFNNHLGQGTSKNLWSPKKLRNWSSEDVPSWVGNSSSFSLTPESHHTFDADVWTQKKCLLGFFLVTSKATGLVTKLLWGRGGGGGSGIKTDETSLGPTTLQDHQRFRSSAGASTNGGASSNWRSDPCHGHCPWGNRIGKPPGSTIRTGSYMGKSGP